MADSELTRLAADISQLSSALTEETGDVDSIIGKFERILRRVNTAGLSVEIPLWDTPPPRTARRVAAQIVTRREIALVFAQSEAEWRLQVRRDTYGDVVYPTALLMASVTNERLMETKMSLLASESPRTKIQALRKFRPLLDELKRRVEADLEAIRSAKKLTE
jgi:hypothetical protein